MSVIIGSTSNVTKITNTKSNNSQAQPPTIENYAEAEIADMLNEEIDVYSQSNQSSGIKSKTNQIQCKDSICQDPEEKDGKDCIKIIDSNPTQQENIVL